MRTEQWIGLLVALVVVGMAVWLMRRSWLRRTKRDETLSAYELPSEHGAPVLETEVLYVATTPVGEPLERLAVQGLAFRGAARIEVLPEGVVLRIAGEPANFLPAEHLVSAGPASYAIDRGVEPDGLIAVTWIVRRSDALDAAARPARVDSYLRARFPGDSARIIAAINDIAAAPPAPRPDQESEASDD